MSENMQIYEKVRKVPNEALKAITGGRLKGMSDINPMWRIKMLTETFGICGFGWKAPIKNKWIEQGSGDEQACFVEIELFIKVNGEWSEAITGIGGSAFVTVERNGPYTSDECFKMAYTDAISVACKSLGFAADVYFANDRTKYSGQEEAPTTPPKASQPQQVEPSPESTPPSSQGQGTSVTMVTPAQIGYIKKLVKEKQVPDDEYGKLISPKTSTKDLTIAEAKKLISNLQNYTTPKPDIADDDLPF